MKKEKSTDENISIETEDSDNQTPSFEQEQTSSSGLSPLIKPVRKKIGEGRDSLKMRSDWFQKRAGTKG